MSVIVFDGFDSYDTDVSDPETSPLVRRGLWNAFGGVSSMSYTDRNGGRAMRLHTTNTNNLSSYMYLYLKSQELFYTSHIIGGVAFNKENVGSTTDRSPTLVPKIQGFKVQAVDTASNILAVTATGCVKQPDPNPSKLSWYANDGTEQKDEDDDFLQNAYRMFTHNYITMPDGTDFDTSKIEAADWGIELIESP